MAIDISKSTIALFQSQDRLELLNDIDKFRQHGLVNLPQIVVCGDTSSGKSSVLEALSGIPFPVDSTMCTRFATEIALRYSSEETVTGEAFITPGSRSSDEHRVRVGAFRMTVSANLDTIPEILREAQKVMGVDEAGGISRDVLHLKLSGRPLPNLTLVDLPGLIHSATNLDDITKVQDLVKYYFQQKESLIMTTVSAENPIENQGILTLSRQFDPSGERSIGVITKPDILRRPEKARLAPTVLELARNQHAAFKFKREWQIMRCLTDDERQRGADRDSIETDLFLQDPWDGFDRRRLGTRSLRAVLCEYLEEHILHVLPELIKSLEVKIASVKLSLQELGPHRATPDERRQYLIRISRRYAQIVRDALNGDYSDTFFDKTDAAKRLRAKTMALTDEFEDTMRARGHTFEVRDFAFGSSMPAEPDEPRFITKADALAKVGKLIEGYRGPELPLLFNPRLVGELFKEQSQKWPKISAKYTEDICHAVEIFLRKVVDSICPSTSRIGELILREVFQDAIHSHQQKLNEKVWELFNPYTVSFLYSTRARLRISLNRVQTIDGTSVDGDGTASKYSVSSHRMVRGPGQEKEPCLAILQISKAYYDVALETFVENVVMLGVESCLLSKLEEMFSPETVAQMKEDKLQLLGGETPEMISERTDLTTRLKTLDTALKNCRRHASREFGLDLKRASAAGNTMPIIGNTARASSPRTEQQHLPSASLTTASPPVIHATAAPALNSTAALPPVSPATMPLPPTPTTMPPVFNTAAAPKPAAPLSQQLSSSALVVPATGTKSSSPRPTSPGPQPKSSLLFTPVQSSKQAFGTPDPGKSNVFLSSSSSNLFGAAPTISPSAGSSSDPSTRTSGFSGFSSGKPSEKPAGFSPSGGILGRRSSGPIEFDVQTIELPPPRTGDISFVDGIFSLKDRLDHGRDFWLDAISPFGSNDMLQCLAAYRREGFEGISFEVSVYQE
ncbi:Dynamin family protein [Fonsecaea pedrosoi]|nr:Dynamin family protein [Fonsecaea pedrosoi]